ncbi:MAG: hypothetical protein ACYS8W_02595 [Planctomycetota bacterium]|jgi:hypothetical protein
MLKTFILLVLLGFGILYGIQLAAYYSIETQTEIEPIRLRGYDPIKVSIMLGGNPNEKFIPGLGAFRILTDEPLRIQIEYKNQTVWHTIQSSKHVDLDSITVVPSRENLCVYIDIKGNRTEILLNR